MVELQDGIDKRQDIIDEIKYLKRSRKENPEVFYYLEKDQDLALEEIMAREFGISDIELEV
jgi:hypothetical protein